MNVEVITPLIKNNGVEDDYFYTNFSSISNQNFLEDGKPNAIMFNLSPTNEEGITEYVMCIDISTTSLGFVLGDIVPRVPAWLCNLTRNLVQEPDYTTFIDNFMVFMDYILTKYGQSNPDIRIVAVKCEKPFYNPTSPKSSLESYNALKQVFQRIESITVAKGVRFFEVMPSVWKSFYLTPVKNQFGIKNIAHSNKEYIRKRGELFYPGLKKMTKTDCFDALGMFLHYLTVDYDPTGIIRVTKSYQRSLKNVKIHFFPFKTVATKNHGAFQDVLDRCLQSATHLGEKRELKQFSYCTSLSSEDNIKACVGINEKDVYFSVIPVTVPLIIELYKHHGTVDSININSKILIVGHRA